MYYSIDGRYKRAPVLEAQIVTSWPRFPLASLLTVSDNCTAIRCTSSFDPLVANFVFNHSSCNRLRVGIHYCAPEPPAGMSRANALPLFNIGNALQDADVASQLPAFAIDRPHVL